MHSMLPIIYFRNQHWIGNNIQFKQIIEESFHLIMYLHLFSTKHFSHSFVIYSQDSQYNNNIQISFYNGPYILHLELLEYYKSKDKSQISVYQHRGIYKIMYCTILWSIYFDSTYIIFLFLFLRDIETWHFCSCYLVKN